MEDVIMHSVESLDGSMEEKKSPKLSYSLELLMKLRKHPLSMEKPALFDAADYGAKTGKWDPEQWHSRTSVKDPKPRQSGSGNKDSEQQEKKRGKEEGDEFCFTPQRRSFVSGCHVAPSTRRQEPEPAPPAPIPENREVTLPGRRVGSGRLTGRDADPPSSTGPKDQRERREIPLRSSGQRERTFEPPQRNDRNERMFPPRGSDLRDKGMEKDRRNYERPSGSDRDYGRNNRYDRRKHEEETPEWFLGGPSSQHDTIELRGFEEERDRAKSIKATSKKDMVKEQRQQQPGGGSKKTEEVAVNGSNSRPSSGLSDKKSDQSTEQSSRKKSPSAQADPMDFNIDEFLKMDSDGLNGLGLGRPSEREENSRGSKASRWFGKTTEQPEQQTKPPQQEQKEQQPPSDNTGTKTNLSANEDAARSLLEMLHKGSGSQPQRAAASLSSKAVAAEDLERSAGNLKKSDGDNGMAAFNKLLAQVQDSTANKPQSVISNAPTEQDILANLLGNKLKMEGQPQPNVSANLQQQPPQDALAKFLQQQNNQMQIHQQQVHSQQGFYQKPGGHAGHGSGEPQPDVQNLIRDVANGLIPQQPHSQALNELHILALQQQQQQQQQQRQNYSGSPQQPANKPPVSSSSPLSFTPTAVMRKMTAEKDKTKSSSQDKTEAGDSASIPSPLTNFGTTTSTRLTGRTASQVQGATRVSNQLGLNDTAMSQQQQQQLLTGRPLVKGQESMHQFPQAHQQHAAGNPPRFGVTSNSAAIAGVAVKMLEQQQQQQLLAAAMAATANQNQFKQQQQHILQQQQQQQQQQRTSPLQQSLMAAANIQAILGMQNRGVPPNVPVGNRTHFRPIHPQPMIPQISGFAPFMGNQAGVQPGQNRMQNGMNMPSSNQFYGVPHASNIRGQNQGLNSMTAFHQQYSGNRSPNMMQGSNPLARWFPPEILAQSGSGQMPALPPMPNQKILSLEELERLHTSPMSH